MKVLHLNTFREGGAANAAYRLHQGLLDKGVNSVFGIKSSADESNRMVAAAPGGLKYLYAKQAPRIEFHFAKWRWPGVRPVLPAYLFPGVCRELVRNVRPDVINLHWVDQNLVSISDLRWMAEENIPIVWTMHDMCPLSGGFGYREDVSLPEAPFGPLVCAGIRKPVSEGILSRRRMALEKARLVAVSPSSWLAEEARNSPVFANHRVVHIPNGVSGSDFFPVEKQTARHHFGLPSDRKIILFGATGFDHPRKGLQHLKKAIEILAASIRPGDQVPLLACFGNERPVDDQDFALPVKALGALDSLADLRTAYSSADLFMCPSREDNLPNTILESLACGTPVLGFNVGGIPDLLDGRRWGGVAPRFDESHLAYMIREWLLMPSEEYEQRRFEAAHFVAGHLNLSHQTDRYLEIYEELLHPPLSATR